MGNSNIFSIGKTAYNAEFLAGAYTLLFLVFKAGAPVLSIYLSKIFNCSLAAGYVPKCWKMKRVSPVHSDVKTDPSNFRPISIFPIPMKIFEKIVHDQVSTFIKENAFLNDRQSGFRKLYSTTTLYPRCF